MKLIKGFLFFVFNIFFSLTGLIILIGALLGVPILLFTFAYFGIDWSIDLINTISKWSKSYLGFSSAFMLIVGLLLIWGVYRKKSTQVRRYYKERKSNSSGNSVSDKSVFQWAEEGSQYILGFGSLALAYSIVVVRLSIDFIPVFFVVNITSWLIASAYYQLTYLPLKKRIILDPEGINNYFDKLVASLSIGWAIPLAAALLSGLILLNSG